VMDVDVLYVSAGGLEMFIVFCGGQNCTWMQGRASSTGPAPTA
jgi:hypothetical protein